MSHRGYRRKLTERPGDLPEDAAGPEQEKMMQGLEQSIDRMDLVLEAMSAEERCRLEKTTQELTLEQSEFVCSTLESALLDGRLPTYQFRLLEHLFECWREHSLGTKLAVIDRVIELSNGGFWPGDIPLRCAMADTCAGGGPAGASQISHALQVPSNRGAI